MLYALPSAPAQHARSAQQLRPATHDKFHEETIAPGCSQAEKQRSLSSCCAAPRKHCDSHFRSCLVVCRGRCVV